jgi:biopolymer transport protein ExbB
MDFVSSVTEAFRQDGIWMWTIFLAQVASIAIIVERVSALYFKRHPSQKLLAYDFEDDIKKGRMDRVIDRSLHLGERNPLGGIVAAGAQAAANLGGRDEIQARMDEVLIHEDLKFERRVGFLAMIGNVATLLGLLGTIVGMIHSFRSVSNEDPLTKATLLSQGISTAMHATAYGLIVAIPSLVMYAVLQNRAQHLSEDLNQGALKIYNWLSYSYEAIPQQKIKLGAS